MILGRHEPEDAKLQTVALREEAPESVAERRHSDLTTTPAEPLPVPRHLLEQLRSYPRLRDLVVGYLEVQQRVALYEEILSDLDLGPKNADRAFWQRLDKRLGAEDLRADFPDGLLQDDAFAGLVREFEDAHRRARDAANAGRNPGQSAQSFDEAWTAVDEIGDAARSLANACKTDARRLLEELRDTVNKIFHDETRVLARDFGASTRLTGAGLAETTDRLGPSSRLPGGKHLQGGAPPPDVESHLLRKRGEP